MDQDVWNGAQDLLGQGIRMVAAAVVSAAVTATLVIAIGHSVMNRQPPPSSTSEAVLIRTSH